MAQPHSKAGLVGYMDLMILEFFKLISLVSIDIQKFSRNTRVVEHWLIIIVFYFLNLKIVYFHIHFTMPVFDVFLAYWTNNHLTYTVCVDEGQGQESQQRGQALSGTSAPGYDNSSNPCFVALRKTPKLLHALLPISEVITKISPHRMLS